MLKLIILSGMIHLWFVYFHGNRKKIAINCKKYDHEITF